LEEARKTVYSALSHSDTPFEVLLKELQVPRSAYHAPLFQAFINYRQELRGKLPFGNCQMELLQFELGKTAYDVSLDIIGDPTDGCLLTIMVQEALYTKSDAQTLLNSYVELLKAFLQNPQLLIGKAPLFREADVKKAIEIGRGWYFPSFSSVLKLCITSLDVYSCHGPRSQKNLPSPCPKLSRLSPLTLVI
jgi:hybrid polyketide synthase/nonribosomal peptide synthetase ACE1